MEFIVWTQGHLQADGEPENNIVWHIEAKTKWLSFRGQQFQMHIIEWKCMNCD